MSPTESDPLLPRYMGLQPASGYRIRQELRVYQKLRALSEGFMPSNDQAVAHLRSVLACDILSYRNEDIGPVGRQVISCFRRWLQALIDLLRDKNSGDQLQDFLWHLARSRASIESAKAKLSRQDPLAETHINTETVYANLRTVGNLFLANPDLRQLVSDLATIGRQILSDATFSLSGILQGAGEQIKPRMRESSAASDAIEGYSPSSDDVYEETPRISAITGADAANRVSKQAAESTREHLSAERRGILLRRLIQAALRLREHPNYSDFVSELSNLIERYVRAYVNATETAVSAVQEEADTDADIKRTAQSFWALAQSLGDPEQFRVLEQKFHELLVHAYKDPDFEKLMSEAGNLLREILTDPGFFESVSGRIAEFKEKTKQLGLESGLQQYLDAFLVQTKRALSSVNQDPVVRELAKATRKTCDSVSNAYHDRKNQVLEDLTHVLVPLLLGSIQRVPIPRMEIPTPEIDLLLENLIIEPGDTVNNSSFLPYRVHITTQSDIDILKQHSRRVTADLRTTFTATVFGLNMSASGFGYWFHIHSGLLFHFKDEGVASFYLDKRGVDISLDVEVCRERLENMFILRGVRVTIYKLDYRIHQGKRKLLLRLTKPFLKHLVRRVLERKIAEEIVNAATALNRELLFARERARAALATDPKDVAGFVRAVLARLKPTSSSTSDHRAYIGLGEPSSNVFQGIYTPNSLARLWHEEAQRAEEASGQGSRLGKTWRNDIFDTGGV